MRKTLQWEGPAGLYKVRPSMHAERASRGIACMYDSTKGKCLLQGVASPLAGQMFFRATLFGAFGAAKRWLSKNPDGTTRPLTTLDFYTASLNLRYKCFKRSRMVCADEVFTAGRLGPSLALCRPSSRGPLTSSSPRYRSRSSGQKPTQSTSVSVLTSVPAAPRQLPPTSGGNQVAWTSVCPWASVLSERWR